MTEQYDPSLSIRANAKKLNITYHKARKMYLGANGVGETLGEVLAEENIDPDTIKVNSFGISRFDTETKTWKKITWVPNPAIDKELDIDITNILNGIELSKPNKKPKGQNTLVISFNDWQLGKGERGGTVATVKRIKSSVNKVKERLKELNKIGRNIGKLVIICGGDLVEGCNIYPNQIRDVDLSETQQVELVVKTLVWGIDQLAVLFNDVHVVAVKGNHGEVRVNGKGTPNNNWDTKTVQLAQMVVSRDKKLSHVRFTIAKDNEEAVAFKVGKFTIATTHGDIFGKFVPGQTKMLKAKQWFKNMAFVKSNVGNADVLITHHYHHDEMADWGKCLWRQTRAQDGGSSYYTAFSGECSEPGMLTFVVTNNCRYQDEYTL